MAWNWIRAKRRDVVIASWGSGTLAFVQARVGIQGRWNIFRHGVVQKSDLSDEAFLRQLQGLGLAGSDIRFVLRPDQYQLLQIDAPQVPPEEIRSAARWKIREMVETHLDDLTLDVCRVGDPQGSNTGQLFVVAARNALVRELTELGQALQCSVQVIDVWDMAQRNLQTQSGRRDDAVQRSDAALVVIDARHALLTISANGELFYSRRIELPADFENRDWGSGSAIEPASTMELPPIEEYVPQEYQGDIDLTASYVPGQGVGDAAIDDANQRLLVEVQRSLDVWDRTWSGLPIDGLKVFAGRKTAEFAAWLGKELGIQVGNLVLGDWFDGLLADDLSDQEQLLIWPLLGLLLRDEGRKG